MQACSGNYKSMNERINEAFFVWATIALALTMAIAVYTLAT